MTIFAPAHSDRINLKILITVKKPKRLIMALQNIFNHHVKALDFIFFNTADMPENKKTEKTMVANHNFS